MKFFFTSDTHFGQERTLNLSKRPFQTVEEMDKVLIENWNKTVSKDDFVFHLGDFGDYNRVKELNGSIILVAGNYEWDMTKEKALEYGFYGFSPFKEECTISINEYHVAMVHRPQDLKNRNISDYNLNLFGHVHKLQMIKEYGVNVGSDCHNYTPIDFDTILFYHDAILHYYDDDALR